MRNKFNLITDRGIVMKNKRGGFTLTELVVTSAIMGTLAAVAVPSYLETNNKAKTDKTIANMYDMGSAIGSKFNEVASIYGTVQVMPDLTPPDTTNITALEPVLAAGRAGAVTDTTYRFIDLLPTIPKSPFGDESYIIILDQQSLVTYINDEDGNISVIVDKARIRIVDKQDEDNLFVRFEY